MVVFSTNVAETSVTINGIRFVIDSGLAKENKFDPVRRMSVIETSFITRASSKQLVRFIGWFNGVEERKSWENVTRSCVLFIQRGCEINIYK